MADDRTEEASAHKLLEARKRGELARSQDIVAAAALMAALASANFGSQHIINGGVGLITWASNRMAQIDGPGEDLATLGTAILPMLLGVVAIAGTVAAATVGISVMQTGMNFTMHPLTPNPARINPMEGFKRLFSGRLVTDTIKTVLKAVAVFTVGILALRQEVLGLETLHTASPAESIALFAGLASRVAWKTAATVAIAAAVDFAYQRSVFKKSMRMSRADLKDEYKNQEGDPHVRARRMRLRRAMAKKLRMTGVRSARVVITNPTHFAVALAYQGEDSEVPRVVAKGMDGRAHRIVAIAKRHGVRVLESPPLARALYKQVEVGQVVPPSLYMTVAEVLIMVQRLDEQFSNKGDR